MALVRILNLDTGEWKIVPNIGDALNVDLTNYYTKNEIDSLLEDLEVDVDLTNYYTKSETNDTFAYKSHSHSNYVPTTRTINTKTLSSNITLSIDDLISNTSGAGHMLTHNGSSWLSAPITTVIGNVVDDAVDDAVVGLNIPTDLDDLVVAGADQVLLRTTVGWTGVSQVPDSTRWDTYRLRVGSFSSGESGAITFGI